MLVCVVRWYTTPLRALLWCSSSGIWLDEESFIKSFVKRNQFCNYFCIYLPSFSFDHCLSCLYCIVRLRSLRILVTTKSFLSYLKKSPSNSHIHSWFIHISLRLAVVDWWFDYIGITLTDLPSPHLTSVWLVVSRELLWARVSSNIDFLY